MARKTERRGEGQWLLTPRAIAAQRPRRKLVPVWTFDDPALIPAPQRTPERTRRKSPLPSRRGVVQNGVTQRSVKTRSGTELVIERGVPAPARRRSPMSGQRQEGFMDIMRKMAPGESAVFPLRYESARVMANRVFGANQYTTERVNGNHTRVWNLQGR